MSSECEPAARAQRDCVRTKIFAAMARVAPTSGDSVGLPLPWMPVMMLADAHHIMASRDQSGTSWASAQ